MKRRHENDSMIIGRFQPFHNGHLEVIRKISEASDNMTIGIGSAQYSHTVNNPFTAGERYLMISDTLKDAGIDNAYIVPMEDLNRHSVWVAHIVSMSPPFSVVYSNNTLT
ncbi:MAG: nicotinamide-nucleotide adenylyltransferase, partial [Methanomassiliicoccaceae archaeon]|nr:nicotinamide-nucleotide adenylyltransferase [Methanomassiliicoccaceae archaeon]